LLRFLVALDYCGDSLRRAHRNRHSRQQTPWRNHRDDCLPRMETAHLRTHRVVFPRFLPRFYAL